MKTVLFLTIAAFLIALPLYADLRLEVDRSDRSMVVLIDGEEARRFTVAVGKKSYPTPTGTFKIRKLIWNPSWRPPDSEWARDKTAKGPRDPDNPMKRVKIFFKEPDYYIHGTGEEDSLGTAASHGCVRMSPDDVTELAKLVMEHGGKPQPEPWYRRIFRRKTTKVVYLSEPVTIQIR